MQVNYLVIIGIVTYILATFTKLIWNDMPHKFIPVQNVIIALISTLICFLGKIEPNFIEAFIMCFTATMGAGGTHDLLKLFNKDKPSE